MGLTARLRAAAVRRPHVLVVAVPGARPVRAAAQTALVRLGWPTASSPADADILLVCGAAGPGVRVAVDTAWDAMPGPRAWASAVSAADLPRVLDAARDQLADLPQQAADARERRPPALGADDVPARDEAGKDPGEDRSPGQDPHAGMAVRPAAADDAADPDSSSTMDAMPDMDMDMDMDLPGGLAMADREDDRDGLRLDVLHVVLGPVLPGWPAGLRLTTVLQGDVVTCAEAELLDACPEQPVEREWQALDDLAALLAAAGWQDGATRAWRARDGGVPVEVLVRWVRSARLLRWSLRGLPGPGEGDLVDHLGRLLDRCAGALELEEPADLAALAEAVTGLDLGSAALVVCAFGPHLRVPVAARG